MRSEKRAPPAGEVSASSVPPYEQIRLQVLAHVSAGRLRPPGLGLLLAEARGIFELNASLLFSPLLVT